MAPRVSKRHAAVPPDPQIEFDGHVGGAEGGVDIAGFFFDDRRFGAALRVERARLRGGIENDRQWIDIEFDQIGGIFGDVLIGGKDGRHRLADIAHVMLRQRALPVRLQRGEAGQPETDRRDVRDVGKSPHRVHAGQRERGGGVDRFHFAVRHRRAHHAHDPLAGKRDIGGETALAQQQRAVFQTRNGAADEFGRGGHFPRISLAAARTALMMFW